MRHWRWAVVLGAVGTLVSIPAIAASLPVDAPDIAVADLRDMVLASADTPFQGLFESRGGLRLPDLGRFDDEVAPFKGQSRVRVWYAAPDEWRADELLIGAERGAYRQPDGLWLWDSGTRRVRYVERDATEPLRVPRLMDLNPAELGRRLLSESAITDVTELGARRIAGRVAAGLRVTPSDSTSTIAAIDIWADPSTGVVLAAEIDTGGTAPIFETRFVEVDFVQPDADVIRFDPDQVDSPIMRREVVDVIEALGSNDLLSAPAEIAGLPLRGRASGVATYGSGTSVVMITGAPAGNLGRAGRGLYALPATTRPWGGEAILIETALVNVEIIRVDGFDIVVGGTVTVAELDRIAGELNGAAALATTLAGATTP